MLQWDSDIRRYSEEFGGDAPFLALASFRKGATILPASREEIARGEFWEADIKEWAAILHTKTIGKRRSHLELAAVLNMGFARNYKEDLSKGPGGRKKKTRIYVAGYDDLRKVDTFSGTPNRDCFLLTLLYVATWGFEVELVDIKNAFLQSPDDHVKRVGVRIPKSIPTMPAQKPSFLTEYCDAEWGKIRKEAERVVPGQIYELSNALYGTPAAPALWGKELRRGQEELGFVPIEQSIAVRREVEDEPAQDVQATHVDDIFGAGERTEEAFDVLGEKFKIGSRIKVNVGSKANYIGMNMYHPDIHTFELTSESYLKGIDVDAIPGKLKKSLSEKDVAPAEEQDVDMSLQGVYQEANGVLGWAVHLNWRRALWFSLLSKATTKPTARHLSAVKTAIHGLKTHREPLVLHSLKGRELHLAGCSDAIWNRPKYEGRQGDMMMLNDESWDLERDGPKNVILWDLSKDKSKHSSSSIGELIAVCRLIKRIPRYARFIQKLWGRDPIISIFVDNGALHD
uniref:Reverse transcriptase Ty1/copia-type domain-containing protein n=1 Tax=Chromera velia CCMP2878 TaxID=1169474 RepID=A0A0G4I2L0_9ALVE|eukprot:Cvel_10423.t1-p1 / transcript=Cvel_10423.t1 / gene=Cvel_10423 / organism=Chromera_velia_CCMP2878 / gene_product=hypothetical protein / transcript_product=hypothetical protein / location=Cvel_scaffold628:35327-36862(+) / protein_length=512 / sequence_SO=supercontig / SO=protein_coding / is_pseudo=false